jgi:hypothetical protein
MGGWSGAARHGNWGRVKQDRGHGLPASAGRWTAPDIAVTVIAFTIRWELGLAFLALKLWHQASGANGSVFAFARTKWEGLVAMTRSLLSNTALPVSVRFGETSSGNHAFDTWRRTELARIEDERQKLRGAERDFAAYRDQLLHAKDREDFDRFMQARDPVGFQR